MVDREGCSESCKESTPLWNDGHISTCPNFGAEVRFLPTPEQDETLVVRGPDGRPVAVPTEIVTEVERDYRAFTKWNSGKTWEEVAHEENYESTSACVAAVKRYLAEGKAILHDLTRQEMIAAYVARLNRYRQKLDSGIEAGKPQAIMSVLAVEDRWVKAFGFDQPDAADAGVQTVVVPSEDYLERLRQASEPKAIESAG